MVKTAYYLNYRAVTFATQILQNLTQGKLLHETQSLFFSKNKFSSKNKLPQTLAYEISWQIYM